MTTVVNLRHDKYDVYIGRGSVWGNPYVIGELSREQVLEKYREHLQKHPYLQARVVELRGKVLGCYCKPEACHGDILAELADK